MREKNKLKKMCIYEFKNYISNRKIVCFGCGIQGKRMADILINWGLPDNLIAFIDNDKDKVGKDYWCGEKKYPILAFKEGMQLIDRNTVLIITCMNYESVYKLIGGLEKKDFDCISIDEISSNQLMVSDYDKIIKESEIQLIPKIIHYIWLGGKMPDEMKNNIEEWKKLCPDYEIKEWNTSNYDISYNSYIRDAYKKKKWAFVSDVMRLDIIYKYGGIYLDTDIKMIKSPDELLYQKCFGCFDASLVMNSGSGLGAVRNMEIIKELRDYYNDISFINNDGSINNTSCNTHSFNVLKKHGFKVNDKLQNIKGMNIYPMILQGACGHTKTIRITDKTFWVHYGTFTWMREKFLMRLRLWRI